MSNQNNNTGSILDQIFEKAANIEHATNKNTIKDGIQEILKTYAKKERGLREATITIKHNSPSIEHESTVEAIEKWIESMEQLPPTFWQDKENTYCQFDSNFTKKSFLDDISRNSDFNELKKNINPANNEGQHYNRKKVKIEAPNVRGNIKIERIKEIINLASVIDDPISEIREGKAHANNRARSILFNTKARNVLQLFSTLGGSIPYTNKATNTRTRIYLKINVKPWQCKDCFMFGKHQCEGKKCLQCGDKGHTTKDCKSKTKTCTNCNKKGHKAKDVHCPIYIQEIGKELRKVDIPLEFYETKTLRETLFNYLLYK